MENIKTNIAELGEIILSHKQLLPGGCRTKTGLYPPEEVEILDISKLRGIVEYEPEEFTITALAGTRLKDIVAILAKNSQYLPFDPPLINQGATLGGTVSAGLSGSGRYRYGGIRDFILGVKFLNSQGKLISAGGRVVKNAAGFDIAKLMIGSLGSLGAIIEVSFKVFPLPETFLTLVKPLTSLETALEHMVRLASQPIEYHCLDIECTQKRTDLIIRIAGISTTFSSRISRIKRLAGDFTIIEGDDDREYWSAVNEFNWLEDYPHLIKVPMTPRKMMEIYSRLREQEVKLRFIAGGNLVWIGYKDSIEALDKALKELNLAGLVILGKKNKAKIGIQTDGSFYRRLKTALDPHNRWVEVH